MPVDRQGIAGRLEGLGRRNVGGLPGRQGGTGQPGEQPERNVQGGQRRLEFEARLQPGEIAGAEIAAEEP